MDYIDFLHRELSSHQKLGAFRPNTLFTRIVEGADLEPKNRPPNELAIPIHVHEYIHYLHNMSTPSGIIFLVNELNFLFEFMKGTDDKGFHTKGYCPEGDAKSILNIHRLFQGGVSGDLPPDKVVVTKWKFGQPVVTQESQVIYSNTFDHFERTSIAVQVCTYPEGTYHFTLDIGIHVLTEGIAYEVDREIRRRIGIWPNLDAHTPPIPYLVFKPLLESLVGRKTTLHERLILGTCALLDYSPGRGLLRACDALKRGRTTDSPEFLRYFSQLKNGLDGFLRDLIFDVMPKAKRNFKGSALMEAGLEQYFVLIKKSFEMRTRFPFMEMAFIDIDSVKSFYQFVAVLAPQWICQEKPNDEVLISWVGHPDLVDTIDEPAMSTLQSAFHYMEHHLKPSGEIRNTADIQGVRCPFSGACQVQEHYQFPKACNTAPWTIEIEQVDDKIENVCFYNSGVRSLFYDQPSEP